MSGEMKTSDTQDESMEESIEKFKREINSCHRR
jgi:hypothetical protein